MAAVTAKKADLSEGLSKTIVREVGLAGEEGVEADHDDDDDADRDDVSPDALADTTRQGHQTPRSLTMFGRLVHARGQIGRT